MRPVSPSGEGTLLGRLASLRELDYHSRLVHATLFAILLGWTVGLVTVRIVATGSPRFVFLLWNLFLATLPWLAAVMLRHLHRNGSSIAEGLTRSGPLGRLAQRGLRVGTTLFWLLFLPNAFYILTDLVHLRGNGSLLYWYDLVLLLSAAFTGLLLGYASLRDVQNIVVARRGPLVGWVMALGALLLSGFGIYLGRILRFNSWDVAAAPIGVAEATLVRLFDPVGHPEAWGMTLLFGGLLVVLYLPLQIFVPGRQQQSRSRQAASPE